MSTGHQPPHGGHQPRPTGFATEAEVVALTSRVAAIEAKLGIGPLPPVVPPVTPHPNDDLR